MPTTASTTPATAAAATAGSAQVRQLRRGVSREAADCWSAASMIRSASRSLDGASAACRARLSRTRCANGSGSKSSLMSVHLCHVRAQRGKPAADEAAHHALPAADRGGGLLVRQVLEEAQDDGRPLTFGQVAQPRPDLVAVGEFLGGVAL